MARGQCPTRAALWDSLIAIENSSRPVTIRLQQVNTLKGISDRCHLPKDSIYARLLHRIGLYEYTLNNGIPTTDAIGNTLEAAGINTSGRKDCSPGFAVISYSNLGHYYEDLGAYSKALAYYDTTINYAQKTGNMDKLLRARISKVLLFVLTGDYQQSIDESTIGLALARDIGSVELVQRFLNQRALSLLYQGRSQLSLTDADSALSYDSKVHDDFELATAYKTKALVSGFRGEFSTADVLFEKAIRLRMRTANYEQIANDYIDLGNYYQDNLQDYARAGEAYSRTMYYAGRAGNRTILSKAYTNLGVINFRRGHYAEALQQNERALAGLTGRKSVSVFSNPDLASLRPILSRDLLLMIFVNKLDASIHLYRQNNNRAYLELSIRTALLADSLITMLRHEQIGEQSKLYWRNKTREIFANGLDACYFSGNTALAFLFMEKSRAVILNDKLNELGALAQLPMQEALIQRQLEVDLTSLQQTASSISADSPSYASQQLRLLRDREKFERYVRSLENKYPVYYQYKYADSVPSLSALQTYLAENLTTFLHFFTTDTVTYILCIEASAARLVRLPEKVVDRVRHFLGQCADEQRQNTGYTAFAAESHHLYELLFQPLSVRP
ncbi:MAG TPA: tetratricopeptide repeat protein, partial [Puia sp.]|nr:tetratricopeptide repeat protein [Puia sp.]